VTVPAYQNVRRPLPYDNLPDFLKCTTSSAARFSDADDFRRITYEALASCAGGGARYVDSSSARNAHLEFGVPLRHHARRHSRRHAGGQGRPKVDSRLIPAHSRELGLDRGLAFLDMVLARHEIGSSTTW